MISGFAYNLKRWASEELERRPELLDGVGEIKVRRDPLDRMSR